jgi:uncharacterized membrane protein
MLGIRGLDPFGAFHAALGIAALGFGALVLLRAKGTKSHRLWGRVYVLSMVALNATALMIYDLYGRFGPFHVAALISLTTIAAGFVPVFARRPRVGWTQMHGTFMGWSYVGLFAAFQSEIAVRIPGVGFGWPVAVATGLSVLLGAMLIHTRIPRIVARLATSD